jgi:Putative zinc-finger
MNHEDAIREMAVEKYLLGELTGESRNVFEEHLFECQLCPDDLKSGATLLEGMRRELAASLREGTASGRLSFLPAWLSPLWMMPALAACLALLVYQSAVVVPGMRKQLTAANLPAVLNAVVLAGGQARGAEQPKVTAPKEGSFLMAVDIPASIDYASYLCSLYAPNGNMVWSGKVTAEQARDAVQVRVPSRVTIPGEHTLVVQGLRGDGPSAKMEILATDKFILEVGN